MKLHLPTLLLGAILACMSAQGLHANDTTNITTISGASTDIVTPETEPEIEVPTTIKLADVEITAGEGLAMGTASIIGDNINLNSDLSTREKEVSITWNDSAQFSAYSLSGNGIMQRGELKILTIEADSIFTIEKGIKFIQTDLLVGGTEPTKQANVIFKGEFISSEYKNAKGENYTSYIGINKNGSINFDDAIFNEANRVEIQLNGGNMIRANHTITQNHTLTIESDSTFTGNLNIASGGILNVVVNQDNTLNVIAVSGALNFVSDSIINFEYDNGAELSLASGVIVATAERINGDLSSVKLTTSTVIQAEGAEDVEIPVSLKDMKLVSVHNGTDYDLRLRDIVVADQEWETLAGREINLTGATIAAALTTDNVIWLADADASVNVLGAGDAINAEFIRGAGGSIISANTQTLSFSGARLIEFDVLGVKGADDVDVDGATLNFGQIADASIEDADIILAGAKYITKAINVQSGMLTINEGTTIGYSKDSAIVVQAAGDDVALKVVDSIFTVGSVVTAGDDTTTTTNALVTNKGIINSNVIIKSDANLQNMSSGKIEGTVMINNDGIFNNNGIVLGDVIAESGATITGSGDFRGTTSLAQGSTLNVGDGAGFQSFNELVISGDSTLNFDVKGAHAATATDQGSGYYSNMNVQTLKLSGDNKANVTIDASVLGFGSEKVALDFIVFGKDSVIDADAKIVGNFIDENKLMVIDSSKLVLDAKTGKLSYTGTIDGNAAENLVGADRVNVANTLWTSTAVVTSFAQHALYQISTCNDKKTNIWGSGLGDFMDMSGRNAFSFNSGGYALGVDQLVSEGLRLGISFGQTFGKFRSDDGQLKDDQRSLMLAIYSNYDLEISAKKSISVRSYFAYGNVKNSATSNVGNTGSLAGKSDWHDTVFSFGTKVEWTYVMNDGISWTPFIGIEYIHGAQEDFTEKFGNGSRRFKNGKMQQWSVPVGITVKKKINMDNGQVFTPELTVAYIRDVSRNNPSVESSLLGVTNKSKGSNPGRSAFHLNAGANYCISRNWSAGAFYTFEVRSKQTMQNASLSARYSF